jgi:hypothetical protein
MGRGEGGIPLVLVLHSRTVCSTITECVTVLSLQKKISLDATSFHNHCYIARHTLVGSIHH